MQLQLFSAVADSCGRFSAADAHVTRSQALATSHSNQVHHQLLVQRVVQRVVR